MAIIASGLGKPAASNAVKTWMVGSLTIETAMTGCVWHALPLPFKIWSVGCLMVDLFIVIREFALHPMTNEIALPRKKVKNKIGLPYFE